MLVIRFGIHTDPARQKLEPGGTYNRAAAVDADLGIVAHHAAIAAVIHIGKHINARAIAIFLVTRALDGLGRTHAILTRLILAATFVLFSTVCGIGIGINAFVIDTKAIAILFRTALGRRIISLSRLILG